MKNLNKILALVLALMMLISVVVVVPASAAEATFNTTALERLVKLGIYKGYGANELGEKDDVTREQMAMFVARVSTGKVANDAWAGYVNDTPFKDINDRPAVNVAAIAYAYDEGIIIGRSADVYDPKGNVSYQEALTMVVRALLGYEATKSLKYPEGFINAAIKMGLTEGIANVDYDAKAIRGVTATILYNALTVEYTEWSWGPWEQINTFANKFNLTTGKYMLTSTTEVRNKAEFTQTFPGTNACVDGDYVVFTALNNDVTFATTSTGAIVDRYVLAAELADDLGADVTAKIGYVYDLTFEGEKLAWVDEYVGTKYTDFGKDSDKIAVADGYLVVNGQKYDHDVARVDLESLNPTKIYDLRLFEYNANAMNDGIAFAAKADITAVKDNMFQEVTLFDTNKDGMFDYGIYMPYYIGNYITSGDYFVVPASAGDYTWQRPGYFGNADKIDSNKKANWTTDFKDTWNTIYVYSVNPVSMDIKTVEKFGRNDFAGEVTKVVNDAITKEIKSATVGGKEFKNINVLTDANLKGISGLLAFEEMERMPTALVNAGCGVDTWENVFQTVLESNGAYKNMKVYSLAGYTIYAWPDIVRNYNFVTFGWADATFSLDGNALVIDRALTDASGNYTSVKVSAIYNEEGDQKVKTFDGMEFEAFCDTIDVLYANPDLNQYNLYFNEARKAAVMATAEYAAQLRLNIMEEINDSFDAIPELYAITGKDAAGNLILTDVDYDNAALVSYATEMKNNANKVKVNDIEFINGIAKGQFATSSRNTAIVTTSSNIVVTDATVFTFVANDGIFTFTGKPDNGDILSLKSTTLVLAANTKQIMVVDRTRTIDEIAIGDVEYTGKFLAEDNTWFNYTVANTWAFNANTNNCPMGFKWLVDNAYLITSDTKLETVALGDGVVLYTYTNLYDLVACKNVEKTFAYELDLVLGNVVIVDRVEGIVEDATLADVFHIYGANNVNWTYDVYVSKFVSGSTVGYYEFQTAGKLIGVVPSFVIITVAADKVTVTTDISKLAAGAEVVFTLVNGVPTGYAVQ